MKAFWSVANWRVWLWLALMTCSDTNPPPDPASFERPNRLAFVCVDKAKPANGPESLVGLDRCSAQVLANPPSNTNYTLHALVTQSSRGEVAAVDLTPNRVRVIDSRPDIPGPTFVPVGEVPTAIAVSPNQPRLTYVANAASRDLTVVHTSALLQVAAGEDFIAQLSLQPSAGEAPGIPYDMLVSPDDDALFVTSPESGWLLRIPLKRCAEGVAACAEDGQPDMAAAIKVPLEESWSKVSPEALQMPPRNDEPYQLVCAPAPAPLPIPDTSLALPQPGDAIGAPQPSGLALDAFCDPGKCRRRLLVADRSQPIIHAVDLDLLAQGMTQEAVLAPIVTGAPTERVAVSPRVPLSSTDADAGDTQYVYAIDSRDGSVLIAQDDRVRNVSANPGQRSDRLDLGASNTGRAVAISLAVLTPNFDPRGPAEQWLELPASLPNTADPDACLDSQHTSRNPARLRGVFLATGLTDGTVRIINVHDMELRACRSCDPSVFPPYASSLESYDPVVRHRLRLAARYAKGADGTIPPFSPWVTPQFVVDGAVINVKSDGTTNDPLVRGLDCVPCSAQQSVSYPRPDQVVSLADSGVPDPGSDSLGRKCESGEGRVCSLADPSVDPFSWNAYYEGAIPGTRGGHGRFVGAVSGGVEFAGDADFCAAGVLGDEDLPAGDQLTITSPLPSDQLRAASSEDALDARQTDLCNAMIAARDQEQEPIAFRIRRAFADHLLIDPRLYKSTGSMQPDATWEDVQRCFAAGALTFQVHTRSSFIVLSSGDIGFEHSVVRQADSGRCVNAANPVRPTGRAQPEVTFDNGFIKFRTARISQPSAVLSLSSTSNAPKLLMNASNLGAGGPLPGVMPVDLRYSAGNSMLYAVDITARGLIPVSLDPVPSVVSSAATVQ